MADAYGKELSAMVLMIVETNLMKKNAERADFQGANKKAIPRVPFMQEPKNSKCL